MVLTTPLLVALVLARESRADNAWTDHRVAGPFICRADFPLAETESLLADLAQLQNDLVRLLAVPPAEEWIEVYLFHDESTYRAYLRQHFPSVPYRRALYVKRGGGPGMVLAFRSKQLDIDVRHECTHALLHAALPIVPLWLDEGLAEYFEVAPAQRQYDNPYLSTVRWKARLGITPHLDKLEARQTVGQMGGNQYRDSWAWVHFMLNGPPEAGDELQRFLADIRVGSPPGLLSRRLEHRVASLQHQFGTHFRSWSE